MAELPVRKRPRLTAYDYSQAGYYFITLCVKDRHELLGEIVGRGILDAPRVSLSKYGVLLCKTIDFIKRNHRQVTIDKFVVMPNHVHLIAIITGSKDSGASGKPRPTNALIPKLVSSIKRYTNKLAGFNLWQSSFHDRIIRNEAEYQRIWRYIDENPARWQDDRYFVHGSPPVHFPR